MNPSVDDFKNQFVRDFPYGTDPNTSILDSDISYAFQLVNFNINPCLFASQGTYTVGYNLLAAHYLTMNIQSSSQGTNGQFAFPVNSKSVGSVSESFTIPATFSDNAYMMMLSKTNYGAMYLQLLLPELIAPAFNAYGTTLP